MRKHSVSIRGHSTSLSLEDEFWTELRDEARQRDISMARLITQVDAARGENKNLSSALRLHVLGRLKAKLKKRR